ncbi:MAG: LysM peptidoglycan-binding domain-containing protein [Chloroflexi bacterium]|nr:MAG: LysM peptidoglycan-binding domain-containing protein [Chloroflexota bacterium]
MSRRTTLIVVIIIFILVFGVFLIISYFEYRNPTTGSTSTATLKPPIGLSPISPTSIITVQTPTEGVEVTNQVEPTLNTPSPTQSVTNFPHTEIEEEKLQLTPSIEITSCSGPPSDWVKYTVQLGDTLFQLSRDLGVSIPQLQEANCLSGSIIVAGNLLYVPEIPPSPTAIVLATPSPPKVPATPEEIAMITMTTSPTVTPQLSYPEESGESRQSILIWLGLIMILVLIIVIIWLIIEIRRKRQSISVIK